MEIPGRDVPPFGGDCVDIQLQTGLSPNRRPEIFVERHEGTLVLVVDEKIVGAFAEKFHYRTGLARRVFDHNRGAEFVDRLPHSKQHFIVESFHVDLDDVRLEVQRIERDDLDDLLVIDDLADDRGAEIAS